MAAGSAGPRPAPHRRHRRRRPAGRHAPAAPLRDDRAADRGRRPRAARPGRGLRHRVVAGARVQHDGGLDERPRLARYGSQRERLETVINSIDDGIVVLDGETARSSPPTRRSCSGPAATGPPSSAPPASTWRTGCAAAPTARRWPASARERARCASTSGGRRAARWPGRRSTPPRSAGRTGHVVQVVEVWRDISERRAAEAQLAESHRLASLGLLASGFSHELNTPLATTLACVEGILRDARSPERRGSAPAGTSVAESAAIARDQLLRCRGVTQNFLRLSSGKASPGNVVPLEPTLAAVARLAEPTARTHGVVDRGRGRSRPRPASGSTRRASSTSSSTSSSTRSRPARAGGHVRLGVEDGDPVRIHVVDDGCGIAPEDQQRIFEPFFSLREGGTGPRPLPLARLRPPLGRRDRRRERAGRGLDVRGDAPRRPPAPCPRRPRRSSDEAPASRPPRRRRRDLPPRDDDGARTRRATRSWRPATGAEAIRAAAKARGRRSSSST